MKAAVIYENGGPEVLKYEEIADPVCTPGGVVIDVEAISLEGGDLLHRVASPPALTPHVVGYACAGRVAEVGAGVKQRAVGDRVVAISAAGSHAAKRGVPAAQTWVIPEGLAADVAACVPIAFGTAEECLFSAGNLHTGQSVLIHAASGGVGMAAIQLAKLAGATVLVTSTSDAKLERLKLLGVDHAINSRTSDFVAEVQRIVGARGVDVVLDSVGGKTLVDSVRVLAHRGRLVSVGVAGRAGSALDAMSLWARNASLHGVYLSALMEHEYPRVHAAIARLLERTAAGELNVLIDRRFALAEAAGAHAYAEGRNAFGRVVLVP